MQRIKMLLMICTFAVILCVGCSDKMTEPKDGSEVQNDKKDTSEFIEEEKTEENPLTLSTEYVPIAFRNQTLIVKRNEKTDLFGLLNKDGNTVLEPRYDELRYTEMGDTVYLRVKNGDGVGIFNIDGSEKIPAEYEDIASAGEIGWLAIKSGKEYLLDQNGTIKKQFSNRYCQIVGDKYLLLPDKYIYNGNDKYLNVFSSTLYDYDSSISSYGHLEIYTLEEQKVADEKRFTDYINNDTFLCSLHKDKKFYIQLVNVVENQKVILPHSEAAMPSKIDRNNNKVYYHSGLDAEGNFYVYDLDRKKASKYVELGHNEKYYQNLEIKVIKSGDFYHFEDLSGKKISEERYADYHTKDNCLLIENIDNKWGVMDMAGNMVIPFGEIEYKNKITYLGEEIEGISNDDNYCFYIHKEKSYEFYSFSLSKP